MAGAAALGDVLATAGQARRAETAPGAATAPPFVARGAPGAFHAALKPLQGEWRVEKEIYIAVGSPRAPAKSSGMITQRSWFGGGRHLLDTTEGSLAGSSYYRLGVLGFSNVDGCYEWVTFDAMNANMMLYRGTRLEQPSRHITLTGVFTDQGLLGEEFAGKPIPMRTDIDINNEDHHSIALYFTPPGQAELLIDRSRYFRL